MLRTWDLRGSVAFYTGVLGFRCDSHSDDRGWASLLRDGVKIMLSGPNQHENDVAPGFTGSLYFRTDDADSLWLLLKDKARICYPIESFDYGMREFAIYDNNGYVLQFGQPIPARGA
jgi:catechol 2,3-dioxygenase-like lactoylglutathione lyase family enzyme